VAEYSVYVTVILTYIEERASVLIAIGNADSAAVNANVKANTEVLRHEGSHAIATEDHLALEEGSLGHAGVLFLGLNDHDGLVLEEVVDHDLVDAHVFHSALHHGFLKVAVEAQDLQIVIDLKALPACRA